MIIFSDMDGTLLNRNHEIGKENLDFILNLREDKFVIATGRNYQQAMVVLDSYPELKCDLIGGNGTFIKKYNQPIETCNTLSTEYAIKSIELLQKENIMYVIHTPEETFTDLKYDLYKEAIKLVNKDWHLSDDEVSEIVKHTHEIYLQSNQCDTIQFLKDNKDLPISKVEVLSNDEEELRRIGKLVLEMVQHVRIEKSFHSNIEIMDLDASKGQAVIKYLKDNDLTNEVSVSVGDNHNDTSMFDVTTYAYVMANGVKEIKNAVRLDSDNNMFMLDEVYKRTQENL